MLTLHVDNEVPEKLHDAICDDQVNNLLDQIIEGLRLDDATNRQKLEIARKYGPLLIQLKASVPHGHFKIVLKKRFPNFSYSKCNRWMLIARHEAKVAAALVAFPDEAWGPKKMVDFLTGEFVPHDEPEECDEEDHWGCPDDTAAGDPPVTSAADRDTVFQQSRDDQPDLRSAWEALATNAEADLNVADVPKLTMLNDGIVSVTAFSDSDYNAIREDLLPWKPQDIPSVSGKNIHALKVVIARSSLSEFIVHLGKTIKHTQPSQLKVRIDL